MENRIEELLVQMLENQNQMNVKLTNLETKVSNLDTKVSNLDTKVSNLDTKVSNLDTKVSNLEIKVSNLETDVSYIKRKVDVIFDQTADLTEFRTETKNNFEIFSTKLDNLSKDLLTIEVVSSKNMNDIAHLKLIK